MSYLMIALAVSNYTMASEQDDAPPFSSITCVGENVSVQIKLQHERQTFGAGPASIYGTGATGAGTWNWKAAEEGTRLTGYHHLNVAGNLLRSGPFYLHTLYNGYDLSGGGWLNISGFSGPVKCKIDKDEANLSNDVEMNSCGPAPHVRWVQYCCNGTWLPYECN